MKKRIASFLFALTMVFALLPITGKSASNIYFIGINDDVPQLTLQTAPIKVGGVTYVPYTIFSSAVVGSYLGVSYIWNASSMSITIYGGQKVLEFDIENGTAYSFVEDKTYNYVAVYQNGMAYVPIGVVARYFGIGCSFLVTEDLNYQVLRLTNGQESMDDKTFLRTMYSTFEERSGESSTSQSGTNTNTGTPDTNIGTQEDVGEGKYKYVTMSFANLEESRVDDIAQVLEDYPQARAIFFFTKEEILNQSATVIKLVAEGHKIGLIPEGENLEEQSESIEESNELLWHMVRKKSLILLTTNLTTESTNALTTEGYVLYDGELIDGEDKTDTEYYNESINALRYNGTKIALIFDETITASTLIRTLNYIQEEEYMLSPARELF